MSRAFTSPYMPKGLTDGSIPSAYASFVKKYPENKIAFTAANGMTATPRTEMPHTQKLPDDLIQPDRTAVPVNPISPLL